LLKALAMAAEMTLRIERLRSPVRRGGAVSASLDVEPSMSAVEDIQNRWIPSRIGALVVVESRSSA